MRVAVAHQREAIELRQPPVHRRIRAHSGLYRMHMLRLVTKTFLYPPMPGHRAEEREPRSPCMGGYYLDVFAYLHHRFSEFGARETEYRPAVVIPTPFPVKPVVHLVDDVERRRVKEKMNPSLLLVRIYEGYLACKQELHAVVFVYAAA